MHLAQLRHRIGFRPQLGLAIADLVEAGILDPAMIEAHDLLMRMLLVLRLVAPNSKDIASACQGLVAERAGASDWLRNMKRRGNA